MNKTWLTKLHYDVKTLPRKIFNISMELFKHETLIYSLSRCHHLPVIRFIQSNDNSFVAKSAIYIYITELECLRHCLLDIFSFGDIA